MKSEKIGYENRAIAKVFLSVQTERQKLLKETNKTIKKCAHYLLLPNTLISIKIKPTSNQFIKDKLYGVGGFTPRKNEIELSIHPDIKKWRKLFPNTLAHEYNHAITFHYYPLPGSSKFKLIHGIVAEGLADNFAETVIGKPAFWTNKHSLETCKKWFPKIKKILNKSELKIYRDLFLGEGEYPLWLGYSISYQIVKSFLRKNYKLNKMKWEDIIKIPPEKIIEKSHF